MKEQTPPQLPPDIEYQLPPRPEPSSSGKKWGIGCSIGCLVALLIGSIAAYLIYSGVKKVGTAMLDTFSATTPIVFTAPTADPSVVSALIARYDGFSDAMKNGTETGPLELTGDEINLLIHHHPDWKELAGHAEVTVQEDQLTGRVSIPLDAIPMMSGRYFNGTATIRLSLVDGKLEAYLDKIEAGSKPLPPEIANALKSENIFKNSQTNPELEKDIRSLKEIRIQGGRLIIVPKPAAERPAAPAEAPPPSSPAK
jgi:hypothetical protein